jgi:hypothetical protein
MVYSQEPKGSKRNRSNSGDSQTRGSQNTNGKKPKPLSSSSQVSSNLLEGASQYALPGSTANPIQPDSKYKDAEFGINPPSKDVQMGKHTDSRRDPSNRMLDRVARVLHNKIPQPKREKTPHLALVKLGKDIHIAGNSGGKHVSSVDAKAATEEMLNITESGATQQRNRWIRKDISKLSALRAGTYHSGENESGDLNEIRDAIQTNSSMHWHQRDGVEPSNGSKHGEMALHEPISQYARKNRQDEDNNKKDIYVGGVQKDCLFCHWAHAILNEYVYKDLGYQVMTSGTHGTPFPGWIAPQELLDNKEALAVFKEKLKTLNQINKSESWLMDNDGKVSFHGKYDKPEYHQYPYPSDSE